MTVEYGSIRPDDRHGIEQGCPAEGGVKLMESDYHYHDFFASSILQRGKSIT